MDIKNKKILITGASSGIGWAITKLLLDEGAKVSTLSRRTDKLLTLAHDNLLVSQGSVNDKKEVHDWVAHSVSELGGVDVLINNAGVMYYMDMVKANHNEIINMINTNCIGFINVVTEVMPYIKQSATAHMISITSDAGKRPFPGLAVYSGTKAFMESVTGAMRLELKDKGIKITNIQPGNVDTDLHGKSQDTASEKQYGAVNTGQYLRPKDIATACLYAINQDSQVAVNEILIEPVTEPI